jgi:hypothetical protein
MIGRGILYRPTLPLEINDMDKATPGCSVLSLPNKFIQRLLEEILLRLPTDESRIRKIKEYWCLLWKSLPISEQQAREVLRETDLPTVLKMIRSITVNG